MAGAQPGEESRTNSIVAVATAACNKRQTVMVIIITESSYSEEQGTLIYSKPDEAQSLQPTSQNAGNTERWEIYRLKKDVGGEKDEERERK
jgi:hypothetical protein